MGLLVAVLGLCVCDNRDGWLVAWDLCGCMLSRFLHSVASPVHSFVVTKE